MALATQCPHCHTTFRVASDQLKLRGGIVRCGSCQRIFDGSAHLIDLEALAAAKKAAEASGLDAAAASPPASATVSPAPAAPVLPTPEAEPDAPAQDAGDQPVYTLDFDHTFDPFGILPKVEAEADAAEVEAGADADAVDSGAQVDDLPPAPEADIDAEAAAPADPDLETEAIGVADDADDAGAAVEAAAPSAPSKPSEPSDPEFAPESEHAPEPQPAPEPEHAPEPEPAPVPAHAYAPAGRIEPSFDLPVDEELVAQPLPGHEPEPELDAAPASAQPADADTQAADAALPSRPAPWARSLETDIPSAALPLRASVDADSHPAQGNMPSSAPRSARAKAAEARARRSKMTPTRIEPPKLRVPAEPDEPEFVKRSRRQEQSGRLVRILMAAGAVLLLLVLAAQLLLNFRNELAVRYPAARPLLSGLCALAGCRVGLPAQAENLVIDDGELSTLGPDTYSLNTQLRNQGSLALAWPSIELELTDANNKPVLRRVFGPADYLPPGTSVAAGFGAHSEQPVKLNFALADLKPSGYHTFVFYP